MTAQFTQQEAIEAILNATKDGDLPLEDRLVLLCEIVKEQQREITHLRVRLEAIRQHIPGPLYPARWCDRWGCWHGADDQTTPRNGNPRMERAVFGYGSGRADPGCFHCGEPASEHGCPEVISDRYDSQHPESEHDGGLGSGDWVGPWEDRR